ncbi:killer toxin Kp4 [Fusarium circinatum]|uniref:Killer toxin Kp4 n=1 Tax=Fusarium circinatum TaxID=48490 RepID=A0A8H5TWU6_FUSCI|nr:killer toxin Kp4 [Fusarium circinatum]
MKYSVILSFCSLAATTSALGINCRGSFACGGGSGNLINLKSIVDNIQPRDRYYPAQQQIACTGDTCAFFQNGASGTAEQVSADLQALLDHGCKKCGSVPTQPGNNVADGQLTVNYVSHPNCQGAC